MNSTTSTRRAAWTMLPALLLMAGMSAASAAPIPPPLPRNLQALMYSTMPSTTAHSPEMALDGDQKSYFKSVYDMNDNDIFMVMFSKPISVKSLRIVTGNTDGTNAVTNAMVETSGNGIAFSKAVDFNANGAASANLDGAIVRAIRIRLNKNTELPSLVVREITIDSPAKIRGVKQGPGRGFVDYSEAPDVADWAKRMETQMDSYWAKTAEILHSDNFYTPNMVRVFYRDGDGVAGTDNGEMVVNAKWARAHDDDTGLGVHEMTHVIQATPYEPVWMVEGIADYIRWVKFEPEHFHPRINVERSKYNDSYQTTATFLGWCTNHYDDKLVTQLNDAVRFGKYNDGLFKEYCGKDVNTLWAEFIADYKAAPDKILAKRGA
ncbi:MAG: basic secretory protein-like protein [Capsulimonas sp.]|uniref:basic secretory protein-like protein n=1 Tax=Capsulimonas sp. TaxID=2494211 RepID=UPI003264ABFE